MSTTTTPRFGFPQSSAGTDPAPSRTQTNAYLLAIDNLAAQDAQGTRAARPGAATRGKYYWATDLKALYRDNGSSWDRISDPAGLIGEWSSDTPPDGFLILNGQAVSRTTYSELFTHYGTAYGVGDGSTTFNLPNIKGKVIVGKDAAVPAFDTLGETGGEIAHSLSIGELAAHTHDISHGHTGSTASTDVAHTHSGTTGNQSVGHTHGMTMDWSDNAPTNGGAASVHDVNDANHSGGVFRVNFDTGAQSASHTHAFTTGAATATGHTHVVTIVDFTGSGGSVGSGTAHNNMQPYIVMHYIVRV